MKVRMISNWSDSSDHPKKDDELRVVDKVYYEDGDLYYYECEWQDHVIYVYPHECQEL